MTRDDRTWTVIETGARCCVTAAVRSCDLVFMPESAAGVLGQEVSRCAEYAHFNPMVADDDHVRGFPKTVMTVTVCLRPVQVMLMPAAYWVPPTDAIN